MTQCTLCAFQIYAIPPSACRDDAGLSDNSQDYPLAGNCNAKPEGVYDIPPPTTKAAGKELNKKFTSDFPLPAELTSRKQSVYDIPVSHQNQFLGQQLAPQKDVYDTPRGVPFPGQQARLNESLNPEGREGVYDVPPQTLQDTKGLQDLTDGIKRLSFSSTGSTRSNMSTSSTTSKESSASPCLDKRLILDPDTAIERLYWLQQTVETAVYNLMAFVNMDWRSYGYMEKHINEIHSTVEKVEHSLVEYLQFAKGSTANASCLSECSLYNKMRRELQRLEDSHQILTQTSHDLNSCSWSLNVLAVNKPQSKCDDLDRFVMVARTVPDDAKQLTTTISVNAEMLFKQVSDSSHFKNVLEHIMNTTDYVYNCPQTQLLHHREKTQNHCSSLPAQLSKDQHPHITSNEGSEKSWMDDYDYVHLQVSELHTLFCLTQIKICCMLISQKPFMARLKLVCQIHAILKINSLISNYTFNMEFWKEFKTRNTEYNGSCHITNTTLSFAFPILMGRILANWAIKGRMLLFRLNSKELLDLTQCLLFILCKTGQRRV